MAELISSINKEKPASRWWAEEEDNMGRAMEDTVRTIEHDQTDYWSACKRYMQIYRTAPHLGLAFPSQAMSSLGIGSKLSLNVSRNMCNTVTSKITKARPKATFSTNGGTLDMREKARMLDKFSEGIFYEQQVYRKTPRSFMDLTMLGTCFVKVYPQAKKVAIERIFPLEMRIDTAEGMNGDPRNIYQVKHVDKTTLAAEFPEHADHIMTCGIDSDEHDMIWWLTAGSAETLDMVRVVEGYHRPSGPGAKDGVMCISCGGKVLEKRAWKYDWFPYAVGRWLPGHIGYYGMGLVEELDGIQSEINRLVRKIQVAMSLLSNPYIFAKRSASIARGTITDIPGSVILYTDVEPRVATPQTVHPEVFAHLDRLYQRAFEIAGISQLSAQSQKPAGLESGRALLVYQDVESDRFAMVTREWENMHMDIARLAIRTAQMIPGYSVKVFDRQRYEEIKWSDIDLDEDAWIMNCQPTSFLPATPAGQLDFIERMQGLGVFQDPSEWLESIERPDTQAIVRTKTSSRRYVTRIVSDMLRGKAYLSPEPHMNLAEAIAIAQDMYMEALDDGVKDADLAKVRTFMLNAARMAKGLTPPPTSEVRPPGMPPPGMPPPGMMPPEMPPGMPPPGVPNAA